MSFPRVVVLDDCGDDPGGLVVEVYDDPQPTVWLDVLAIEALSSRDRVQRMEIWTRDGAHDHVDVVEQPGTAPGEMQVRAGVKDDESAIGIGGLGTID